MFVCSSSADIDYYFCLISQPYHFFFFFGIAAIAPFSHRLAFDSLPEDIQRLRCKVNFQALTFVPHINELGEALVHRLRYPARPQSGADEFIQMSVEESHSESFGKFVVLHLRFDKVMYQS